MDDWGIVSPTRWKLKTVMSIVSQVLQELRLEKHPDKTYIGRARRGFDSLGYFMRPGGLAQAVQTLKKHAEHIARLYEQRADSSSHRAIRSALVDLAKSKTIKTLFVDCSPQRFRKATRPIRPAPSKNMVVGSGTVVR